MFWEVCPGTAVHLRSVGCERPFDRSTSRRPPYVDTAPAVQAPKFGRTRATIDNDISARYEYMAVPTLTSRILYTSQLPGRIRDSCYLWPPPAMLTPPPPPLLDLPFEEGGVSGTQLPAETRL